MTFEEILDQAIAMVQRRGRVTYRTLKLQFALDDEQLATLKDELLYSQPHVVDDAGRGLLWIGDRERPTDSPPSAPSVTSASPQGQPTPGALQPAERTASDAERRQLTVLFCDLVDSTRLSNQLDPEDYREVVHAYHSACTEVIQRYEGHIAQYLGDGLLVYFGFPVAHEDDAHRAVRTGLEIINAVRALNTRLEPAKGIRLAVRQGIHTGVVVVGAMGGAGRQEQLALGEVPNVCARLQGLAEPNTVAMSAASYRLVQGYFECRELGEQTLRGVTEPMAIYRVLGESGVQSRLEVAATRGLTPLVGREQEVGLLLERWEQAKSRQGHVVLLTGDAGIGKSRLVQMLKDHVANEPHTHWECRSSPYFDNTALFPVTDLFQRLLRFHAEETPDEKFAKLEQTLRQYRLPVEETVPLFAPLLSLPIPEGRYPPLNFSPQRQRQKTLESLVAILLELAERQPVLFVLEDLHWSDPSTLELLNLVIEQTPTASLLTVLTCRPTFHPSWTHRSFLTEMSITRLAQPQVERMVERVAGSTTLPPEVLQQIIAKTDGVPLFVEEMTKAILESGHLKEVDGHYELTGSFATFAIPATLQDSLMARLDRLGAVKGIAQLAAVIGRQFPYDLLQAVSQLDEVTLQRELRRLVDAALVYQRGVPPQATYTFKHALIQDAAYASLLKSTRQHYHQRIAQVLETHFPATVETQPELLAYHCTEAGLPEQAVHYWQRAGQCASERSAHVEAISHLRQGLAVLLPLPERQEHVQRAVAMHLTLGASLLATQGYAAPEVGENYMAARRRCAPLADPSQLFPVLRGLWNYAFARAEYQTAHTLGEQLLVLAQQVDDTTMLMAAHRAWGQTCWVLGAAAAAHTHFAQGIALYAPLQHRTSAFLYGEDAGVFCRSLGARTLWSLGYPDQGRRQNADAVTLAQQIPHPFSLGFAWSAAALFHQCCREVCAVQECADAAILFAKEQGFPFWMAFSAMLRGWALGQQGQAQDGIAQLHDGLRAFHAMGVETMRPYWLALLAETHRMLGELQAGLTVLTEAMTLADTRGERWYDAELHRLKGEFLLQQSSNNSTEAEVCFHHALDIARTQQTKTFELRAATSLARLWQQHGKRQEAHDLLAPVYGWFTEGFDTPDLQEAKALLGTLV